MLGRPRCVGFIARLRKGLRGMITSEMSKPPPFDPFPYPHQLVVAFFDDEGGVRRASEALLGAGFAEDRFWVLHGEDDAVRLDAEGEAHGRGGRLVRALQELSSVDLDHVRRHAAHVRAGGYVVGVAVGDDEAAKQRAVDAMRSSGGGFINYYADNYIEYFESA